MQNSTRRGSRSLPLQVQSQLYHFKSRILALVAAHVFNAWCELRTNGYTEGALSC